MNDDSLSDVKIGKYGITQALEDKINAEYDELFAKDNAKLGFASDPWIVGKDDYWFIHNNKRLHKESWNAAIDAAISEVLKTYPYSAKEARIIREQLK